MICMSVTDKLCFLCSALIHILNHHDPGSALVHNSFASTVCWEVPLWHKLRSKVHSTIRSYFSSRSAML